MSALDSDFVFKVFFGVLFLILLLLAYQKLTNNLVQVRSTVDGVTYWVQNLPDRQEAADLIGTIHMDAERTLQRLRGDPNLSKRPNFQRLLDNFKPTHIQENLTESEHTSYSENKGERIVLCIRNKDPGQALIDKNTVMFVFLHELGHLMTESTGHTQEFWDNFKELLQEAVRDGIYDAVDYESRPTPYCGMTITDSPLERHGS